MARQHAIRMVIVAVVVGIGSFGRADKPVSFDGIVGGKPPAGNAQPGKPGHGHGGHAARCPSTSYLFFGVGPGYYMSPGFGYSYVSPSVGFGFSPWAGYVYDPWWYGPYLLAPGVPLESQYGPLAVQRFLGLHAAAGAPASARLLDSTPRATTPADIAARLRTSNEAARQRARQWMARGDSLFHAQRCHEALQRYKSAIEAAPDLAEAYVRQGFALIVVNQPKLAAKAFKISLHLDPEVWRTGFQLDDLYQDNHLAKTAHLELLAQSSLDRPEDADLVFLVGMMLWADGDRERARGFLQKAHDMVGPAADFLNPLLNRPGDKPALPDIEI